MPPRPCENASPPPAINSPANANWSRINSRTPARLAVSEDHVREVEAMLHGEEKRLEDLKRQDIENDIHRAEKEVAIMKARRDQARFALEECVLKAPRRGSVLRLLVGPGDVLSSQPKQPAVQFAIEGPLIVRADVEQEFVGRIAVGQSSARRG